MYCPECKVNYKGEFKYCVTCNEELIPGKVCGRCCTANSEYSKICNLCGEFIEEDIKKTVAMGHETLNKTYKECMKCHAQYSRSKIYCEACGSNLVLKMGMSGGAINFEKQSAFCKVMSLLKIY